MDGRDRFARNEEEADNGRIQNDWNGSAKVAILSIQRSQDAWMAVIDQFPDAMKFVRPGFDDIDAVGVSP